MPQSMWQQHASYWLQVAPANMNASVNVAAARLLLVAGGINAARRKKRPPAHEYIRHLIFVELSEQTIASVLRHLLRLPWQESER